jgi:hypothetical protein
VPRSNSRSSTFLSDSGKRTYIITTSRMTSGEELKYRNGLSGLPLIYEPSAGASSGRRVLPRCSDSANALLSPPNHFQSVHLL